MEARAEICVTFRVAAHTSHLPYPDKHVIKHECVGHDPKRVGKYVRELKKDKMLKDEDSTHRVLTVILLTQISTN